MKRLTISVVMVAVGLGVCLAPRTSEAAEGDMRDGNFAGNWCGWDAQFDVGPDTNGDWVFSGTVLIKATGQVDKIKVKQYGDNSLRIVRYLTGKYSGQTQWVDTFPPETKVSSNGTRYVNFMVKSAGGYGSKPLGHLHIPFFKYRHRLVRR